MADLSTSNILAAKLAELAQLTNSAQATQVLPVVTPVVAPSISIEQIEALIAKGISDKLESLRGLSVKETEITKIEEVIKVEEVKSLTPLEQLNSLLTEEEIAWICNPEVLLSVAPFLSKNYLSTDEGRTSLYNLFNSYRKYYNEK
jgi:hypothetical protein